MKNFLAGLFICGCWWNVEAQSSKCEETLNQATEEFSAGHFYEIAALLKPCLDRNDFTNEQRVRANLLLTQSYLILDDPKSAEASFLKLLKADPEYVATEEKDPIDVVYLSKKFTSTPIFTPHVRIGLNTSIYRNIYANSLNPGAVVHHGLRVGFQFGGGIDFNINDNWSLCADGIFATRSFKSTISNINSNTVPDPNRPEKNLKKPESDEIIAIEKHFGLDVPVYLKYAVDKGQIRPFGYVGLAANFLFSAKANIVLNNRTGVNTQTSEGPDVDVLYQRRKLTRSIVLGGGLKYKIGKDYLFVDVRYMAGMQNLTAQNIYSPPSSTGVLTADPLTRYAYVSPYFRLDNISISLGYIRPLYDPRKIRKLNVRNIFHWFDRNKQ